MSATTLGHQGVLAVERKEYETAIAQLDKALESSTSPAWLLARATAHQQLKHYDAALRDAELAYHVAAERGSGNSRRQMIDAQYRRSVIYFRLGRYADSDCCARWSMRLAEGCPVGEDDGIQDKVDERGNYTVTYEDGVADCKGQPGQTSRDSTGEKVYGLLGSGSGSEGTPKTGFEKEWKRAYSWRSMALGSLGRLPEDDPGRKVSVTKVPPRPQAKTDKKPDPEPTVEDDELEEKPTEPEGPAPGSVPDEKLKLRADFYQSAQNVTISLFVKDAKKENLDVKFSRNQVGPSISEATAMSQVVLTRCRSKFHPSPEQLHPTSNPVTERPRPRSFSTERLIPRRAVGPSRRGRSNSSSRRLLLASSGALGAEKRLVLYLQRIPTTPSWPPRPQRQARQLRPPLHP
jgi:suppressor of G2 allele of SKP1